MTQALVVPSRKKTTLAVAATLWACAGCGASDHGNAAAAPTACSGLAPEQGTLVPDALTIGTGSSQRFVPSMDGDDTELIIGAQGGYMAVPLFRVDSTLLGTDGACAYLRVEAAVEGRAPADYALRMPDSSPSDRYWFFGTLPLFLTYDEADVLDRDCTYTAAFIDDEREADAQVTLHLVDNE